MMGISFTVVATIYLSFSFLLLDYCYVTAVFLFFYAVSSWILPKF